MTLLEEDFHALRIPSQGFTDIPEGAFNTLLEYCEFTTVAKLRLVNRATKAAVERSGRIRTKLVCDEAKDRVVWTFDERRKKSASSQFIWNDSKEANYWLSLLTKVEWSEVTLHEGQCTATRIVRQMSALRHVAMVEEALEIIEKVRPFHLKVFNVEWPIGVGWPGLGAFVKRVNASTLPYTVKFAFWGDIPAYKNPRIILGNKFKDVVFRGWTDIPKLLRCIQFARNVEVDRVVFYDIHGIKLSELAKMVAPCAFVKKLELADGCSDLDGPQPNEFLSPKVSHFSVSNTCFHNARSGRYGSCPVEELTVLDTPDFTEFYTFPNIQRLTLMSDECHDPFDCHNLIKRVRSFKLMAHPSGLPKKDVFSRSRIVRLEIILHVTKISRDGHPRVLAPVRSIKTLSEFTLILSTWKTPSPRTLKPGNEYRTLLNDFARNLANSENMLQSFNVGIFHRQNDDAEISFKACQQTLTLNSQQLKTL
ncbi:hypothetical protein TRICI_001776 [Trichomonascus ciferrii]|uniref:F-box domain-containing protein n=1 Tax=Trichomonascus ciferrii TaxID=44093 RepID=A0A642V7K6_9ASCO|nr:hypothetical protein TRICI_001776 [Trichomonascus ciferrii]